MDVDADRSGTMQFHTVGIRASLPGPNQVVNFKVRCVTDAPLAFHNVLGTLNRCNGNDQKQFAVDDGILDSRKADAGRLGIAYCPTLYGAGFVLLRQISASPRLRPHGR